MGATAELLQVNLITTPDPRSHVSPFDGEMTSKKMPLSLPPLASPAQGDTRYFTPHQLHFHLHSRKMPTRQQPSSQMHMCVCVCTFTYTLSHSDIHPHTHIYMYIQMQIHMFSHTNPHGEVQAGKTRTYLRRHILEDMQNWREPQNFTTPVIGEAFFRSFCKSSAQQEGKGGREQQESMVVE